MIATCTTITAVHMPPNCSHTMLVDSSGLGLGVSAGIALGTAAVWRAKQMKRLVWRAAEAAELSATPVR